MANVDEKPSMMGLHLRRAYGNELYIIPILCAITSNGLLRAKPLEDGSIESTLAGAGPPLMFLDIRMSKHGQNKETPTWLSKIRSVGANVSAQGLITLDTSVDGFVFVNTLTPAIRRSDLAR
jgi:hypothetical protein